MTATSRHTDWFRIFRTLFGLLIMFGIFRFVNNGWIRELYIVPDYHFFFPGFSWIKALPGAWMYIPFAIMFGCGLAIALNRYYRAACAIFFLCFTYVELIDVTYYLNHYYLVSLLSFILIFYNPKLPVTDRYNQMIIFFLKLQVSVVYFYGGVNKIGYDWLIEAQPLKIWLYARSDLALVAVLLKVNDMPLILSWLAMLFDIGVSIALWHRKTRLPAYIALCIFHLITAVLFNIGIFPWVMMIAALLFFQDWPRPVALLPMLGDLFRKKKLAALLPVVACWQILFPLRHLLYDGNYLWTERGFRFSWNIMLMEKNGQVDFAAELTDGTIADIEERGYLTAFQEKMTATQPDLIVQFAAHIRNVYLSKGIKVKKVFAICHVSLNGKRSVLYFDPGLNLLAGEQALYKSIAGRNP